ncbi:MAG: insulinase family protein, partial [Candidatus Omnitrophica bacterium]|nr:insulinase family protein [Candidatus Omnitrophota bacterium]
MLKRMRYLLTFALLAEGSNLSAASPESVKEGLVKKFILNNGLTILVKKIENHPLVSLEILVKTGSAREGNYAGSGVSHCLEHLIFKGTEKYPAGEIARQVKLLGGEIQAFTTQEYTAFSITVPRDKAEEAGLILKDSLFSPLLKEEEFLKERRVILNEMLMNEDEPERKIYQLFWQNFYRLHPYKYPVIGYPELFSKLTLEELKDYHRLTYVPQNMILSIVGGISEDDFEKIKTIFSQIERGKAREAMNITEPEHISPSLYEETYPTKLMYLILGFPGIEITHPDLYGLDLLASILGEGKSSRLYRRLITRENLVYSLSCFNHTPRDKGIFAIYLVGEYADKERIIKIIWEEINRIKKFPLFAEEVNRAKNRILHQYYLEQEKVQDQAHQIATGEMFTGEPEFYSFYVAKIKAIKPKDLRQIARKYLREESLMVVTLIPAYAERRREEKRELKKEGEEIEKFSLKNGLTLLLKEDHTLPTTTVNLVCLGGLRLEEEAKNGISNLCANLLPKGTLNKSSEEINQRLEKYGGTLSAFSGNNSLGLSLSIISENTLRGIHQFAEIIKFAQFPEEELKKEKNQVLARIKQKEDDPLEYLVKRLKRELFSTHPYGRDILGEKESIERIKLEEVREFYHKFINPKNCVLSVMGDFAGKEVRKVIEKEFSSWKRGENFLSFHNLTEAPIDHPRLCREEIDKTQALVGLGFRTVSLYSPQYY